MKNWYRMNSELEHWGLSDSNNEVHIEVYYSILYSEFDISTFKISQVKYGVQFIDIKKKFPTTHPLQNIFRKIYGDSFNTTQEAKDMVDSFLAKISKMKSFL